MSRGSEYANAVGNLYQLQAQNIAQRNQAQANAKLQKAQIWTGALGDIGQSLMNLPQAMRQRKIAGLQEQELLAGFEDRRLQRQQLQQIQAAIQNAGGDLEKALPEIMGISEEVGRGIQTSLNNAKKSAIEMRNAIVKGQIDEDTLVNTRLAQATDPAKYFEAITSLKLAGVQRPFDPTFDPSIPKLANEALRTPQQRYESANPKPLEPMNVPPGGKIYDPNTKTQVFENPYQLTPDQTADNARLDAAQKETERHNKAMEALQGQTSLTTDDSELVSAVMQNPALFQNLTPTVKTRIGAKLAAQGFTQWQGVPNAKPSSGQEKAALGFFNRAKQADTDLSAIQKQIAEMGYLGQARMAIAPNFAQSELGQLYNQAQRAFTEARLRKDSGAAIPPEEFENDRRTYFVQPGDDDKTIAQKERGRASVLASMAFQSGSALKEFYGDDADSLIPDYRQRSGGASPQTPQTMPTPPTVGDPVTFNGKRYRIKAIENGQAVLEPIQ